MTTSNPIRFFDIASGPPVRPYAPNPCKARYALNVKRVPYQTQWVELPDVEATRRAHEVEPVRKHMDGSDFYTLPFIQDPATGALVGDSFDIALYLDATYPNCGPRLIPHGSVAVYRAFNAQVDAMFSRFAPLMAHSMPLNPESAERTKAEFVRRFGLNSWDDVAVRGEQQTAMLADFKAALEDFSAIYKNDGPFLEGHVVSYADIIVGGWVRMASESLAEWDDFCEWQGGRWKRLHQALNEWADASR